MIPITRYVMINMTLVDRYVLMRIGYRDANPASSGSNLFSIESQSATQSSVILYNDTLNTFYLRLYGVW